MSIRRSCAFALVAAASSLAAAQEPLFKPGFIYASELGIEPWCYFDGHDRYIVEINPANGASRRILGPDDGLCMPNGLAFTPDGRGLRVQQAWASEIREFNIHGGSRAVYGFADGLRGPTGYNGIVFDVTGDFYVSDDALGLTKFVGDHPPGTPIGMIGYDASLAAAPSGDVFVVHNGTFVYKVSPDGVISEFDRVSGYALRSVAVDQAGNVFISAGSIFRYDNGDASTRRMLAQGVTHTYPSAITMSADDREIFAADWYFVYGVDKESGAVRIVHEFTMVPGGYGVRGGTGITVYNPPPIPTAGDLNCDGSVNQFDIDPFILALVDAEDYRTTWPDCQISRADLDANGSLNQFDIQPFVELLTP